MLAYVVSSFSLGLYIMYHLNKTMVSRKNKKEQIKKVSLFIIGIGVILIVLVICIFIETGMLSGIKTAAFENIFLVFVYIFRVFDFSWSCIVMYVAVGSPIRIVREIKNPKLIQVTT